MRAALLLTVLTLLCWIPARSMGQEIFYPPGILPKQMHVPEPVIYGILFHQAAVFKDKADALDRSGGDGSAYRHHMEAEFGLTPQELMYLNEVAIEYQDNIRGPESDLRDSVTRFRARNADLQRGHKALPPPTDAKSLLARRDAVTLRARDEFRTLIGKSEFARIDALLKERIALHLLSDYPPASVNRARAAARKHKSGGGQGILGYTSIDFDPNTLEVTAYSATVIYGYAIYYYEPIVSLKACGEKVESERDTGPLQSNAFVTLQCRGDAGQIYYAYCTHSARIAPEDLGLQDDDYYGLERWDGFDVQEPFSFPFTSFSPDTDTGTPVLNLGMTYDVAYRGHSYSPAPRHE